ncbi:YgiW/YdeI family stress tolerance OB fold protein [Neisseria sp. Ec49-e6-T10]|uniref:YgiW/YdeI family stress tolerance OB fold protein n=1 Tax=Neisseria sp. Ec49-e6-T10 TaxID=3140744 RepID=UPI003EB86ABA
MKLITKLVITTILIYPISLFAQGGFVNDGSIIPSSESNYTKVITVSEAKKQADDTFVLLEGYIVGKAKTINAEEFMFKDDTDTIKIEVNQKVWRNQTVTPSTKIRILGQVDHNSFVGTTEIEVRQLDIIKD